MRTLIVVLGLTAAALGQDLSITGIVRDSAGPVRGATVRVQATSVVALTDETGRFRLASLPPGRPVTLTAWAQGYYNAGPVPARPGDAGVILLLARHTAADNENYAWLSGFSSAGQEFNCQNCHAQPGDELSLLPFDEWRRDAHGTSAANRRFLSMYNGTDLGGEKQSPPTRYFIHKDYGPVPLPPDPSLPYYGPGFKLDFPNAAGNCASCHLPAASVNAPLETDPNQATGVGREGVACDFCHKIWGVQTDPYSGMPYPNTPGILSLRLRRPPEGGQLFLGPYDDVPGLDTYSPLQQQSRICAPCHVGTFWGVEVYNSFGEWLASPYADPENGRTCQDCHMPRRGATRFARAGAGGLERDPATIFSHLMPGASDQALLQSTAEVRVEASQNAGKLRVQVTVLNANGGHHIPTDHPARNILLVVSAADTAGNILKLTSGPVLPEWAGTGNAEEDYAGRPGRGYAKILEEMWTEVAPTVAYWMPTILREDTRIPALASDVSHYEFEVPAPGVLARVRARLIFRRAFRQIARWKGWQDADVVMNDVTVEAAALGK